MLIAWVVILISVTQWNAWAGVALYFCTSWYMGDKIAETYEVIVEDIATRMATRTHDTDLGIALNIEQVIRGDEEAKDLIIEIKEAVIAYSNFDSKDVYIDEVHEDLMRGVCKTLRFYREVIGLLESEDDTKRREAINWIKEKDRTVMEKFAA